MRGEPRAKNPPRRARRMSASSIVSLPLHVLVRQMARRVFGGARLALHVLAVHALAWRELLCPARRRGALAGSKFGLARTSQRRCGLRHRDGGNAEQRNGKHAGRRFHGVLPWLMPGQRTELHKVSETRRRTPRS